MQNRFGLKDFVIVVLLLLLGIMVYLNMRQGDRIWNRVGGLQTDVAEVRQQVGRVERRIETGVAVTSTNGGGNANGGTASNGTSGARDDSWARPGVPIKWQPAWTFARDPRGKPDYRTGGEFTEVFEAQPSKLTAYLGEDVYSRRVQDQVLERLAEYDPKTLELRGVLAEAWQFDPNGMWLRIKLRENTRFSDGMPVTADDVVFTFHDYVMNPQHETEQARSILQQIDSYSKLSEHVVEVKFNEANAYNLSAALVFYVLPKHFYGEFTPKQINEATALLMGSGPFRIKDLNPDDQWTPGTHVVLERNEQYWGPKPALDSLRYYTINNEVGRLTAFTNGDCDMIIPTSPQFVQKEQEPGWEDRAYPLKWVNMRSSYGFIGWQCGERNGKLTPFHDKRVRLAMTHILDRELMIRDIWSGIGEVATGPNNDPSPACNPDITPWPYDPDRARELLTEAGWEDRNGDGKLENEDGDPFTFEFTRASGGQISERVAKYIKDQCASVGIDCTVRAVDWALYDQILKTRDFDALIMGWSASSPESDLSQIWHTDSINNQGHNFIQWDAGQDVLIEGIRTTLDFKERMAFFHRFHSLVHEEQPYTFVRVSPWLRFISKDFENVHPYPKGLEQREYYPAPTANF